MLKNRDIAFFCFPIYEVAQSSFCRLVEDLFKIIDFTQ